MIFVLFWLHLKMLGLTSTLFCAALREEGENNEHRALLNLRCHRFEDAPLTLYAIREEKCLANSDPLPSYHLE